MLGSLLALAIAGQPGAAWLPVHEDEEATTSIAARAIGRAGGHRTVAVRTTFRDAAAGGFIHGAQGPGLRGGPPAQPPRDDIGRPRRTGHRRPLAVARLDDPARGRAVPRRPDPRLCAPAD